MIYVDGLLASLTRVKKARSLRAASWDTTGRNNDAWNVEPGETRVIADIQGPGCINHIWMTQPNGYRNVLIRMFWDGQLPKSKDLGLCEAHTERPLHKLNSFLQ